MAGKKFYGKKSHGHKKTKTFKYSKRKMKQALSSKKEVKKIVKKVIASQTETLYLDHKFAGSQGSSYQILPWGVDSDLDKGNVCGDLTPVNQLDNIKRLDPNNPEPLTDSYRNGDSIFLKSIRVQLRLNCPEFQPAVTPATTAINKQGPSTMAKVRLLVILDTQGQESIEPASTTAGVLAGIYDDIGNVTALRRALPTFKSYKTDKRYKVLHTRHVTLDAGKVPYVDLNFSVKVDKKITYYPAADTCLQGIYLFAMSDYPASTTSHTQIGPTVNNFWLRYYYSDP